MRKSINPMFGIKNRGEACSGSAPSLIVLMSLRQLFLGELHSCIARLRFAGRSIFRPGPVICQLLLRMWRITPGLGRPSQGKLLTSQVGQIRLSKWATPDERTQTAMTNEQRIKIYLTSAYAARTLQSFTRDELQAFLNQKAAEYSYSIVAHLRWGLRQIFRMAVEERHLDRNPAELLFIPREAKRPEHRVMNRKEVKKLFEVLDTRERLIAKLAILAGMRTGEIFALTWKSLDSQSVHITQRVYHGDIDSPKTHNSVRKAALSDGLAQAIEEWRKQSPCTAANAWVFPSENVKTPVVPYNLWRRQIGAKLRSAGLSWVTFQVMRRTHSSLLRELDVAPEVRAQQMGHTVDVNENVYTKTSLESRRQAVNLLEAAIG